MLRPPPSSDTSPSTPAPRWAHSLALLCAAAFRAVADSVIFEGNNAESSCHGCPDALKYLGPCSIAGDLDIYTGAPASRSENGRRIDAPGYQTRLSSTVVTRARAGYYDQVDSIGGSLNVRGDVPGWATLDNLNKITAVAGSLWINQPSLTRLTGLANLTTVGGAVDISGMPNLRSLDGLAALRRVQSTLKFAGNGASFNYSALSNLECHGGFYWGDPSISCPGCPSRLLNLPRCS